jgi:hypothetical protein
MKTRLAILLGLCAVAQAQTIFPNGLDDWAKEGTNTMGYWLATTTRIEKLPNGKFEPQMFLQGTETNLSKWEGIFEGGQYKDLGMAQYKLRQGFRVKKEVSDAIHEALKPLADIFKPIETTPTNHIVLIDGPGYTNNPAFIPRMFITNIVATAEDILAYLKRETNYAAAINLLVTSGEVCKVRGHSWFTPPHLTLEYRFQPYEERKCALCGKFESRSMPPWSGERPWQQIYGWPTNYFVTTNLMISTNFLWTNNIYIDVMGTNSTNWP